MTPAPRPRRLALVHTVGSLAPVFDGLCRELLPGVEVRHAVDESLLADAIAADGLTGAIEARLRTLVADAATAADLVLVTCSSMGDAVDRLAGGPPIPVLRVDEAMVDEAVRVAGDGAGRVGVAATLRTTLAPTTALVARRAHEYGVTAIEVEPVVVAGAFATLRAGDDEGHDRLVRGAVEDLAGRVDVVLLAQASMARALTAAAPPSVPVLSSPRLGVERARDRLAACE